MPHVDWPGARVWYAERRDSSSPYPPLVLVHGAGGSHLDWPAELFRLPGMTVLALDLPGHGRSPGPGRQSIDGYAGDVIGLMDALDLKRAIVGGHSMGGAVAQMMAINCPERVAGLILISTGARLRVHPDILSSVLSDPASVYERLRAWMWAGPTSEQARRRWQARMAATEPGVVHGDYVACNAFDVMDRVSAIAAPALILVGTADRMTPPKFSAYLAAHIPGAQLVTVEGGGHLVMLEQPLVVAQAIAGWLTGVDFGV